MAERSGLPIYGNISTWTHKPAAGSYYNFSVTPRLFRDSLSGRVDYMTILETSSKRTDASFEITRDKSSNSFKLSAANSGFRTAEIPFETSNLTTLANLLSDTLKVNVSVADKQYIFNRPVIKSQPTDSMLRMMMHRSDNFFAEQSLVMVSNNLLGIMDDASVIDTY